MVKKTCDNCGDEDQDLTEVFRVYQKIDLNNFDPDMSKVIESTVEPNAEMWCKSCMCIYPNVKSDSN